MGFEVERHGAYHVGDGSLDGVTPWSLDGEYALRCVRREEALFDAMLVS
jgi:hypothetical protein